jgi:hypothetical protein
MRGRVARLAGLGAVALPVLVLVGWVFYSRSAFGTWNPMAQPTRISYCDRTYIPGPHVTRAHIGTVGNGFGVFPFRQVGGTAAGTPIYAKPLPDSLRHQFPTGPVLPCDMAVYLKVGADDYIAYGISGGP